MKKLFLTLLISLFVVSAFAQVSLDKLQLQYQKVGTTSWHDFESSPSGISLVFLDGNSATNYLIRIKPGGIEFSGDVPLQDGNHPFFHTADVPSNFISYWTPRLGLYYPANSSRTPANGWQDFMDEIVDVANLTPPALGTLADGSLRPIFYIKKSGGATPSYELIDGLMNDFASTEQPLQLSGDYPEGYYGFEGHFTGDSGTVHDLTLSASSVPVAWWSVGIASLLILGFVVVRRRI